jgi:hypothetical protein
MRVRLVVSPAEAARAGFVLGGLQGIRDLQSAGGRIEFVAGAAAARTALRALVEVDLDIISYWRSSLTQRFSVPPRAESEP